MHREITLESAKKIVTTDRENQYGAPEDNFNAIANFWGDYLRIKITPKDVAVMMILLKIARIRSGHGKDDNWIDICGYASIGGELET